MERLVDSLGVLLLGDMAKLGIRWLATDGSLQLKNTRRRTSVLEIDALDKIRPGNRHGARRDRGA